MSLHAVWMAGYTVYINMVIARGGGIVNLLFGYHPSKVMSMIMIFTAFEVMVYFTLHTLDYIFLYSGNFPVLSTNSKYMTSGK